MIEPILVENRRRAGAELDLASLKAPSSFVQTTLPLKSSAATSPMLPK